MGENAPLKWSSDKGEGEGALGLPNCSEISAGMQISVKD